MKEFGENTFLFINKIFGFVVEKGEKNPRESDSDAFISNVFKHFDQMVKMNERQLIKQKKDESKKLFSVSLLLINAKFLKLNPHIPSERRFHTFLLDNNNNVILIGDPTKNRKIKNMIYNTLQY